jgi:hypothetical protein
MEVKELIEKLSEAAEEAIEQAAAEAARAAMLASLEREAAAWTEAHHWQGEYQTAKRNCIRTAVITGAICLLGGFVTGAVAIR